MLLSLGVKLSLSNETDIQKLCGNKIYTVGYVRKNDDKKINSKPIVFDTRFCDLNFDLNYF